MKRHPLDWFSLLAGLFVTAVATAAFVGPWRLEVGPWAWPTMLVLAGLVIIVLVLAGSRRQPTPDEAATAADIDADPDRGEALEAAYAELDDDMTLPADLDPDAPGSPAPDARDDG